MQKYGIASFKVETLEECSADDASERECYWIQKLGTFKYGYNATIGGDGKHYADYDLIYRLWQEGKSGREIAKLTGYTTDTVKAALDDKKVTSDERKKRSNVLLQKPVVMLDKVTKEELRVFPSLKDAYIFLGKQHSGQISAVCNGKRKTAYGYSWKYI